MSPTRTLVVYDALMCVEIRRRTGNTHSTEVRGSAQNPERTLGDLSRGQGARIIERGQAQPQIDAFRQHVNPTIGQHEIEVHLRVLSKERG